MTPEYKTNHPNLSWGKTPSQQTHNPIYKHKKVLNSLKESKVLTKFLTKMLAKHIHPFKFHSLILKLDYKNYPTKKMCQVTHQKQSIRK